MSKALLAAEYKAMAKHPWQPVPGKRPTAGHGPVHRDPILQGTTDGYTHRRLESGVCATCDAGAGVEHTAMRPAHVPDVPIYWSLVAERIEQPKA